MELGYAVEGEILKDILFSKALSGSSLTETICSWIQTQMALGDVILAMTLFY